LVIALAGCSHHGSEYSVQWKSLRLTSGEMLLFRTLDGTSLVMMTSIPDSEEEPPRYRWRYRGADGSAETNGSSELYHKSITQGTAGKGNYQVVSTDAREKILAGKNRLDWNYQDEVSCWLRYYSRTALGVKILPGDQFDQYVIE